MSEKYKIEIECKEETKKYNERRCPVDPKLLSDLEKFGMAGGKIELSVDLALRGERK